MSQELTIELLTVVSLSLAGIQASSSGGAAQSYPDRSATPGGFDIPSLEQQCFSLLSQGLAPCTHKSYSSAQAKFTSFCRQLWKLHLSGSPCPADEWTFCLFANHLASSIKVYLSGVRATGMHIEQGFSDPLTGFSDPLTGWLRLQRVLRGIKRLLGSPSSNCLPITDNLMLVIWKSLDLQLPDHCMFWAACTLVYFGFLRAAEFTVPSLANFSPLIHLGVKDISVDSASDPSTMCVKIKASKTDPFHKKATSFTLVVADCLCVLSRD